MRVRRWGGGGGGHVGQWNNSNQHKDACTCGKAHIVASACTHSTAQHGTERHHSQCSPECSRVVLQVGAYTRCITNKRYAGLCQSSCRPYARQHQQLGIDCCSSTQQQLATRCQLSYRAVQSSTGQDRAGPGRTGQDRVGQQPRGCALVLVLVLARSALQEILQVQLLRC